jgi:hypothetical protein
MMRVRRAIEASTSSNSLKQTSSSFCSSALRSRFSASALAWMALLVSLSSARRVFRPSIAAASASLKITAAPAREASTAIASAEVRAFGLRVMVITFRSKKSPSAGIATGGLRLATNADAKKPPRGRLLLWG